MNADATNLPPLPPADTPVASCDDDVPINEADLDEAFLIAGGETLMHPELRHLVALVKAYDEALDMAVGTLGYIDRTARLASRGRRT